MTLKDFLKLVAPTESIYLRSSEGELCTKFFEWFGGEYEFKYGDRKIVEISTTRDEFFDFPIIVVRIEGKL